MREEGAGLNDQPLLRVRDASCHFDVSRPLLERTLLRQPRQTVAAVDHVSFEIFRGQTFALVGESGSGKTTLARCLVGLHPLTGGGIDFDGAPVSDWEDLRSRIQMVFQNPFSSLNPRMRVRNIVAEPLRVQGAVSNHAELLLQVFKLLELVGLPPEAAERFPHEFSGGERQRISIARALSTRPKFLVCDEPTSALDVSVQAQVLNLLRSLQRELRLTCLFLSHDLGVVRQIADHVGVMHQGRLCETGEISRVFSEPRHPYTQTLLDAVRELEDGTPS